MYFQATFVLVLIAVANASIVAVNRKLEVRNGRTLYIRKNHLKFATKPGEICKVQVVKNEPMYQRVGEFSPKVFDCDYLKNSIRYQHYGSPFLSQDVVKFRVSRLLEDETIQETVLLQIDILNSECDVIKVGRRELQVSEMNGVSNPITKDVVQFNYDRLFRTNCEVRIATEKFKFPEVGQLVLRANPSDQGREYNPAGDIAMNCDDFVLKGFRYQHLVPPTPDIDYIPLHVIITDKRSRYILKQEYHWLPVGIAEAYPNEAPRSSYSNMNVLEVDQFVTTNLLSTTMSAVDSETNNAELVFNITKTPEHGFIVHLNDESKPVESFYQKDIGDLKIAYQPPNISFSERQTFIVEFVVYDKRFVESRIIQVLLSVRVSHTSAPRISWNMGLTMLEGQSRKINKDCLQVVDSDSMHLVRITLAGGLQHGRLFVNDRPGYSFSWTEIENDNVLYQHDDSETTRDYIMFQVSDGFHSTRFKLPIEILPKDDSPPVLVNNVLFEVAEGQVIHIYTFMLEAYDQDSSSDYVKFNITNPPRAGQIQKRRAGDRTGWEVQKFDQRDLYEGNIIYQHHGDETFDDSFDFVLIDSTKPVPNVSPLHTARIRISPVDDQPPKAVLDITRSLTLNETDVAVITSDMLEYIDEENPGSTLKYILTSDVETLDSFGDGPSNNSDAGHLFYTDDMVMLMKSPNVPHLKMFTQDAVDHNKVAYMPLMKDVGLYPMDVHFEYSVSDAHGTKTSGEQFFITILPVDNKAPVLDISLLSLREGGTLVLSVDEFEVTDDDSMVKLLRFIMTKPPKHGRLELNGQEIQEGDSFQYTELEEFSVQYSHDGSENFFDSFEIIATDGIQNSSAVTTSIVIEPVDDEIPIVDQLFGLLVNESSSTILTSEHLHATDRDTDNEKLVFEVAVPPLLGILTVNGEIADSFTQREIENGEVAYQHTGDEIGVDPKYDVVSFVVMDRHLNYDGSPENLDFDDLIYENPMETYDLNITILPVNNRPPEIILGSAVFHCDEGGRHALSTEHIWATDLDTPQEKLVFKISKPQFGVVEDATPREGYEKQISVPVNSFSLQRLQDGNIFYVQSRHKGIEPTADTFLVSVTDGKHSSAEVPFLIAIIPTNDESPEVQVSNFSCGEGEMFSFSDSVLNIVDLDVPSSEVMISVSTPPSHGMLIDEMEMRRAKRSSKRDVDFHHLMHGMEHISEFSLHDWSGHRIQPAYVHDGTEHSSDMIKLKISDGKFEHTKEMGVKIVLMNDEKPTVVSNKGITVELGESQTLNNVVLYSTDADSPSDELFYVLYSTPSHGKLQVKVLEEWQDLQSGDSFTEEDLANNKIRYLHTNIFSTKSKDSFRFSVTDGTWTTKRENFEIKIRYKEKKTVHVVTGLANVKEGGQVFITTEILSARDGFDRPEDISYEIISEPMYGQVEYISHPDTPISLFTQLDLMSRRIIYRHQSKEDSALDSFTVSASNGVQTQEGVVTIQIEPVDVALPTLTLFPTSPRESSHLTVFRGASVTINDMILSLSDPDTSKDHVRIVITSYPEHGSLSLDHEVLDGSGTREVSQTEIENAEFMYEHNGDPSFIDRFSFLVTDGAHAGYLVNGKQVSEATTFNIRIEQLDEQPPQIAINIPATSIEPLGSTQYAVYIDSHNLMAVDEGSDSNEEIIFSVTEPPSYGMLKKISVNSKLTATSEFSMQDLKLRKFLYVIDGNLNVTSDSFTFDVQDDWGNVLMGNRFSMSWSRFQMVGKSLTICENQNQSSISVKRYGQTSKSAFVGVKIVSLDSADENDDFVPSMARQIQFDPGSSTQDWTFKVLNDGIRERKEKFKILLHSPVNGVLEPQRKDFVVVILDAGSRNCKKSMKPAITGHSTHKTRPRKGKDRKKSKSGKTPQRKGRGKNSRNIARDQPARYRSQPRKTRKYGKLGRPITVAPATYFRNGTHKIRQYHGIIPITIDEEEVPDDNPGLEGFGRPPKRTHEDEELINDEPQQTHEGEVNDLQSTQDEDLVPRNPSSSSSTSITRLCNIHVYDHLYFDYTLKKLLRCDGVAWVPWSPSKIEAAEPTAPPSCEDGWHQFENKCYLVYLGDTEGQSWNSAQRQCREEYRAQLVSIASKKHMNWLRRKSGRQKLWIGLHRKITENWEWAGGEDVVFTNWKRGYRKHRRKSGELNCALSTERKRWIAKNCSERITNVGFACMRDMVPIS